MTHRFLTAHEIVFKTILPTGIGIIAVVISLTSLAVACSSLRVAEDQRTISDAQRLINMQQVEINRSANEPVVIAALTGTGENMSIDFGSWTVAPRSIEVTYVAVIGVCIPNAKEFGDCISTPVRGVFDNKIYPTGGLLQSLRFSEVFKSFVRSDGILQSDTVSGESIPFSVYIKLSLVTRLGETRVSFYTFFPSIPFFGPAEFSERVYNECSAVLEQMTSTGNYTYRLLAESDNANGLRTDIIRELSAKAGALGKCNS